MEAGESKHTIIFDGVCNLCTSSVIFIIRRDPRARFRFASLQNEPGQILLNSFGLSNEEMNSIALIEGDRIYTRSTAVLRIARRLRHLWPLSYAAIIIPKFIRDPIYDWIARNRYRWFGRKDLCYVPSGDLSDRFLD